MGVANIAKIVIVLGLVVATTVLMYSEMGIAGGPPGIGPVTFPAFNNPFAPKTWTFVPASEGPNTGPPRGTSSGDGSNANCVTGFTNSGGTTWGCVQVADGSSNYVNLQSIASSHSFSENISSFPGGTGSYRAISMTIGLQCTSEDATTPLGVSFSTGPLGGTPIIAFSPFSNPADATTRDHNLVCPVPLGTFANVTMTLDVSTAPLDPGSLSGSTMLLSYDSGLGAKIARVSEMHATITYQRSSLCIFQASGNPWDDVSRATYYVGCVLAVVGQFMTDAFAFFISTIIYIGQWLIAIGSLVGQAFATLAWFLAIPGTPSQVQLIITAILVGFAVFLLVEFGRIVRGTSS